MGRLSSKLRSVGQPGTSEGICHWCPGCDEAHVIYTKNPGGPVWTWNGNVDTPITSPSVLCFDVYDKDHKRLPDGQRRTLCHYFLGGAAGNKPGMIEFCGDCPHPLSGQTVPLPDFPHDRWGD